MTHFMQIAYDEAYSGMMRGEGGPFGAVIVRDDEVIAKAHNEVLLHHDPTAHAEIQAIRYASQHLGRQSLHDCVLYTTCKPCPMCLGAIMWARIPKLYYAADERDAARGGFDDANFYHAMRMGEGIEMQCLDPELGRALFMEWAKKEDRTLY